MVTEGVLVVGRQNADCRYPATKGRCHDNRFWDYVSCKWTLMGDNDMRLLYKEWFVFSQPLRLFVALPGFVVAPIGTAPGGRLSDWEFTR